MKSTGKAADFLRKTVGALRAKAAVLRARILFLASLRRRMAVVAGISRHVRALTTPHRQQGREKAAPVQCRGTAVAPAANADDDHVVGLHELAQLFEQVADENGSDDGYPDDWTLTLPSLFDDDDEDTERRAGDLADDGGDDDEPSVIDVIRRAREGDGRVFRIEDEIDQAADMYITRVRRRIMNAERADGAY